MRDSSDFLAGIRAAPDDDAPRLVYADWLEENGDATRAELIRVQCELSRLPWYSPQYPTLQKRETELFGKHKDQWLGDFSAMVRSARFERGFVESVALGSRQFERNAESILARAPIRKVSLTQVSDSAAKVIADLPVLSRIENFEIHGGAMTDAGWKRLLTSEHLRGLRNLKISVAFESDSTTPWGVLLALAGCPSLAQIHGLQTTFLHLDEATGHRAFEALNMPSLRLLALPNTRNNQLLQVIRDASLLPQLTDLRIPGNYIGRQRSLRGAGESATALERLSAPRNRLTDKCIGSMGTFPALRQLDLAFNEISDKGLVTLMTQMPRLTRLSVVSNQIRLKRLKPLKKAAAIADLRELAISGELDGSGLTELVGCLRLQKLTVSSSGLTDWSILKMLESPSTRHLLWLDLSTNRLSDVAANAILDSPYLDGLRFLSLKENSISLDMQQALRSKYGTGVCTFSRPGGT